VILANPAAYVIHLASGTTEVIAHRPVGGG
jgi:hypothetical protein